MIVERAKPHPDEKHRLEAVRNLRILDSRAEERYERLTSLAATILDAPIALVTIVDRDRQWFKSRFGFEVMETPRDIAFCAHAIVADSDEPFRSRTPGGTPDSRTILW